MSEHFKTCKYNGVSLVSPLADVLAIFLNFFFLYPGWYFCSVASSYGETTPGFSGCIRAFLYNNQEVELSMLVDGRYMLAVFCPTCLSHLCSSDVYNTSRMGSVCVCICACACMCMPLYMGGCGWGEGCVWVGGGVLWVGLGVSSRARPCGVCKTLTSLSVGVCHSSRMLSDAGLITVILDMTCASAQEACLQVMAGVLTVLTEPAVFQYERCIYWLYVIMLAQPLSAWRDMSGRLGGVHLPVSGPLGSPGTQLWTQWVHLSVFGPLGWPGTQLWTLSKSVFGPLGWPGTQLWTQWVQLSVLGSLGLSGHNCEHSTASGPLGWAGTQLQTVSTPVSVRKSGLTRDTTEHSEYTCQCLELWAHQGHNCVHSEYTCLCQDPWAHQWHNCDTMSTTVSVRNSGVSARNSGLTSDTTVNTVNTLHVHPDVVPCFLFSPSRLLDCSKCGMGRHTLYQQVWYGN